jgi:hypothetical protein
MTRWPLALLLAPVVGGGCLAGSASPPPASHARPSRPGPPAHCVAAWNGPANAAIRTAEAPPRGPYPWYAHRPIRPQGGFRVFIGQVRPSAARPAGTRLRARCPSGSLTGTAAAPRS